MDRKEQKIPPWFPLSQVKSKSPDRWEEFTSIWRKWVEEADPRGKIEIYRDRDWLVIFWLLNDTYVPFFCYYKEAVSMLSLNVVIICKSKTWIHDIQIWQSHLNALFWELFLIIKHFCHTFLPTTPTHSKGSWWLPFHNRNSSRKEGDHAEIPKSWKASTEPRPESIFPCLGHQPVRSKIPPACALISPKVLCLCLCFWKSRWQVQADSERNGNVCRVSRKMLQKKCMAISPTSNLSAWHIKLGSFTTFYKWHLDMLEDPNGDSSHKKINCSLRQTDINSDPCSNHCEI